MNGVLAGLRHYRCELCNLYVVSIAAAAAAAAMLYLLVLSVLPIFVQLVECRSPDGMLSLS